ncbi:ribonuclease J [Mycoplasmopsis alligatoris]|uniref:Uncharacterized protein n=1 Tax=Mycoplasmopsis alligatoris A21JP2 TaxID=747682 RepID=D4XVH0_9BACT|nr:ribonuclease J [Mycoplasmopsis alligatoris]EFF41684.1 conserved hypothetical protein [Mycoplasmopsis alligatoris A21JP2]
MNHLNLFALGGLDENGKNMYVLEYNNEIYIINSGAKIPITSTNGVDTLIPNFEYLENNKDRIKGIFITDVKNESFSALPWLLMSLKNIKVYTSSFNKIIIIDRLNKYKIDAQNYSIEIINKKTKIGSLEVMPLQLAGSMMGTIGFDFITESGDVLFLFNFVEGNLGIYGRTSYEEIKKQIGARKVLSIVVDAGFSNYTGRAIDKIGLPKNVKDVFATAKNDERIIIGAYDEEMTSIHEILDLAIKYNRPVVTYGKTYGQLLHLVKLVNSNLALPQIVDYKTISKHPNAVVLVTGAVERLYSRFLRITDNNDVFLKLKKTDIVIMIAPPINGLESLAAVALDEVARITPKIVEISLNEYYKHKPARQDLINMVKVLEPKYLIPAQGLYRYLVDVTRYVKNATKLKDNNCILLQNGKIAHFVDDKLFSVNGRVKPVGDTIIDGFGVGDISAEVISERETLGREGVILISVLYNPKSKELLGKIQINYIGVIDKEEKKEISETINSIIIQVIRNEQFNGLRDLQEKLRKTIRKKVFKLTDKEPMVSLTFNTL